MQKENEMTKKESTRSFYDYALIFVVLFLCAFGLVMLYSTTSYADQLKFGDSFRTTQRQAFFMLVSFAWMIFVSKFDYHIFTHFSAIWYIGAFGLCVLVLTGFGSTSHGASRWIDLGFISFQPSETMKLALILAMAALINAWYPFINTWRILFTLAGIVLFAVVPIIVENLSTGVIVALIGFLMVFVASRRKWPFFAIVAGGVALLVVAFQSGLLAHILKDYQMDRIYAWLDPTAYAKDEGYQILQGLYAIGSGGLFGKGLGQSIQKLGYLPEAQNDMIFSIICEELGLFGASLVIILFLMLIWRLMFIANNAPDLLGSMVVTGVLCHIAIQVLFNIAVVTNVMPNTGVSLPFISYGGTSVLFLMTEMGIVLNVSDQIRVKY